MEAFEHLVLAQLALKPFCFLHDVDVIWLHGLEKLVEFLAVFEWGSSKLKSLWKWRYRKAYVLGYQKFDDILGHNGYRQDNPHTLICICMGAVISSQLKNWMVLSILLHSSL